MNRYRQLLAELAVPRRVGSPEHARVREVLERELRSRGCVVLEHEFSFRPPGRLAAPFIAGGMVAYASGAAAIAELRGASNALIIGLWIGGLVVLVTLLLTLRTHPVAGINVIGVRPRARVRIWLSAHYDSKGQPISMFLRIVAVVLSIIGVVNLAVIIAARAGAVGTLVLATPGVVGGLLLLGNRVGNGSPGAVDNASALVTVLAILDQLPADLPVGVLFPDAEEYGLLGASALVRERANLLGDTAVLNFDGIDDRGQTLSLIHRAGPLVDAVAEALGRSRRWLPVVVDGMALSRAARECATVVRGDWRTARIVHTPEDTVQRLTLSGMEEVSAQVARALRSLGGTRVDAPPGRA